LKKSGRGQQSERKKKGGTRGGRRSGGVTIRFPQGKNACFSRSSSEKGGEGREVRSIDGVEIDKKKGGGKKERRSDARL